MRSLLATALDCSSLMSGCSFFGYSKLKKAERAPAAEAEKVTFPNDYEAGIHLDGPALAALSIALNEFMPPGSKADTGNEPLTRCLSRRDTYDATVVKAGDALYFVNILPDVSRCGIVLDTPILDAGAVYAIDRNGRILSEL
jgi:hypothetical protein